MDTRSLVKRIQGRAVRLLVKGPMPNLIVGGTLALAGFSAAALNPGGQHAQSGLTQLPATYTPSNCYPDPDGDGNMVCWIGSSELAAYSNGYCYPDPDGDGNYKCYISPSNLPH